MRERTMPEAVAARLSVAALMQDLKQDGWDADQAITITLHAGKYHIMQQEAPEPMPIPREPEPYVYTPSKPKDPKPSSRRGE